MCLPLSHRRLDLGSVFPHSSLAITRLGRIVIGRWQLTAGGLLREPAQLDDARRDTYGKRSASHGVPVRHFWRWSGHWARVSHGPPRRHVTRVNSRDWIFLWR